MTIVTLTPAEFLQAHMGAGMRFTARRRAGSQRKHGQQPNMTDEIIGVCSELSVAKYLGVFYVPSPGRPDRDDVAGRLQVRSTLLQNGSLTVYQDQPEDLICVLVLCDLDALAFRLAGWMHPAEAKQDRYWRTDVRSPAYFVPQSALQPIDTLRAAMDQPAAESVGTV